jgi:hypothetical protein
MTIASSDLVFYGSASMPETDVAASGGAIATTVKPFFTQMAASDTLGVRSSAGGDVAVTVRITGRLVSGTIDFEDFALNGVNRIVGAKTFERILKVVVTVGVPVGIIRVDRTVAPESYIVTLEVGFTTARCLFYDSASEVVEVSRYEKIFAKNTHATDTLQAARVLLTADPSSRLTIGLCAAVDDATSTANRRTAPAGVAFVDDNVEVAVPGFALAASSRIGIWLKQTLTASDSSKKSTGTVQLKGTTT